MKKWWAQLRPTERRWAVGIGVVVFLVINYIFIWPHLSDWSKDGARITNANTQIKFYGDELRHKAEYERKLAALQSDGSSVLPEDQAIDFINFYNSRAINNHVVVNNSGSLVTRTNEFFLEQLMGISVTADETNLVNFLYDLSSGNSTMRVRAMSLHPDPSHLQLNANITLVASYQKKITPSRTNAVTAASAKAAPAAAKTPVVVPNHPTVSLGRTNKVFNPFSKTATNNPNTVRGGFNPKRP